MSIEKFKERRDDLLEEIAELKDTVKYTTDKYIALSHKLVAANEENKKLRECVEIYAKRKHWFNGRRTKDTFLNGAEGYGIAENCLKELKGE